MELVPHFFWKHVINGSEIKEINSDIEAKGILRTEHTPTPPTPSTDIDFHAFENLLFFFFFCFLRFFGQGCPPPAPFKKTMLRACVSLCFMKLMDCNGCLRNTFEVVFWALLEKPEKLRLIIWGLLSYDNLFYSFLLNKSKGSQTRTHLLLLVKKNKITNNVSIITKKEKNPNKQQNTNNQNN